MSRDPLTPTRPVVLVVDDEEMLRDLACMMFDDAGFEVITASTGSEAIEALKTKPDIGAVFTDVHMPGQPDGIELARHIREVCPDCAIIVVSGRGVRLPDLGARVRYFNKPFEVDRVVGTMRALMGLGELAR
jgi:two-component system, response regulator PdtaR